MADTVRLLPETVVAERRLGRHVDHDERSRAYDIEALLGAGKLPTGVVEHHRHVAALQQGDLGSCFPSGTRIRMADGSERPIEQVKLLDRVVTAGGGVSRVLRTMVRDEEQGLVRLVLWGHSHLRMTDEHPVLTSRGFVMARELVEGDEVAMPRYMSAQRGAIAPEEHVLNPNHRVVRGNRWQGLPGRRGLSASAHVLPGKIDLDPEFGRLVGLFLAEGSCDSSKVTWTYALHESDTLARETVDLLANYGVDAHLRLVPEHHTSKVVVHGTAWTRLLSSLCGNGSGLKRLHPDLTSGPPDFLEAVLDGWLDGDGHVRPDGSREGITISADLALGMFDIAQALGRHPVIVRSEPVLNWAAATRKPRWTLTMAAGPGRCRQTDEHVWRKVRSVVAEDYSGPVFDLTVEGAHSYVAEGVGVHNCTGNALVGALMTEPLYRKGSEALGEPDAVEIYEKATLLDNVPGSYPPDDTGSSGLAVCKAAKQMGLLSSYRHAFSWTSALRALAQTPIIVGVSWYDSFDEPDAHGYVSITPQAQVRGGHEFELVGFDADARTVHAVNSWGTHWGLHGRFTFSWDDLERLLSKAEQGDATIPIR